jgi:type IV pilus assembly protein PilY1
MKSMVISLAFAMIMASGRASAAAWTLADIPLVSMNPVKPNVIIAIDDSVSMDFEVLLPTNDGAAWWNEAAVGFSGKAGERNEEGSRVLNVNEQGSTGGAWTKYAYLFPEAGTEEENKDGGERLAKAYAMPPLPEYAWARSPEYNTIYFDPAVRYEPWAGTGELAFGNVNPQSAPSDAFHGSPTFDLTVENKGFFRVQAGMRIPPGILFTLGEPGWRTSKETITVDTARDVSIGYFPAVFYLSDTTALPAGYGYTGQTVGGLAPDGRTPLIGYEIRPGNFVTSEAYHAALRNFANWFSYHRKRHAMSKAVLGSLAGMLSGTRVGVFRTSDRSDVLMKDLKDPAQRKAFLGAVYGIRADGKGSPGLKALKHIGSQYARTDHQAPITHDCQHNMALLLTDGFSDAWKGAGVGNADGDQGSPFADNVSDTMADIAMHFYKNTLRSNPGAGIVPVSDQCRSKNPDPWLDCRSDPHMVTLAITPGSKGRIFGVELLPTSDPYAHPPSWPEDVPTGSPSAVDDIWHATINGRGTMLGPATPGGIDAKLAGILYPPFAMTSSIAALAKDTTRAKETATVYQATFNSMDWSGGLKALKVGKGGTEELWDAALIVEQQAQRRVFTSNPSELPGSRGKPFDWNHLSAPQRAALDVDPRTGLVDGRGRDRVEYLSGDRTLERSHNGPFRTRGSVLGDIVHSDPLYVWREDYGFHRVQSEGVTYREFRSEVVKQRPAMIYVGANDGMLHGFDAKTGEEVFAYVPDALFPKLTRLTSQLYEHAFYVDGSPKSLDVYIEEQWRTVLVSSLGAGGRAVFALDVTDPINFGTGDVLWETDNARAGFADLGHVLGQPSIVRLNNGKWAAIFGNGVHTAGHKAVLYVVDVGTGELIRSLDTEADGDGLLPNGLGPPRTVDRDNDRIADAVYAGDLHGNLWKFDLSNADTDQWKVAFTSGGRPAPLFSARDVQGAGQPITTRPACLRHPHGGMMVLFGTGKFHDLEDAQTRGVQTFYGIMDLGDVIGGSRSNLLKQEIIIESQADPVNGLKVRGLSNNENGSGRANPSLLGWYLDLVSPSEGVQGERLISEPLLVKTKRGDTAVLFNTMIPAPDSCSRNGSGWLMQCDVFVGGSLGYAVLDAEGLGAGSSGTTPVSGISSPGVTGYGAKLTLLHGNGFSRLLLPAANGTLMDIPLLTGAGKTGRQSWRQIR